MIRMNEVHFVCRVLNVDRAGSFDSLRLSCVCLVIASRMQVRFVVLTTALLSACGGALPAKVTEGPETVKLGASSGGVPVSGVRSTSADEMKLRWPLPQNAAGIVYADGAALMKTALMQMLVKNLLTLSVQHLSEREQTCLQGALASIREVAFGKESGTNDFMLLRYDKSASKEDLDACFSDVFPNVTTTKLPGAEAAFEFNALTVARDQDFYMLGTRALVESALLKKGTAATWPEAFALHGDQKLVATVKGAEIGVSADLQGSVSASNERFAVDVDGQFHDEQSASRAEEQFNLFFKAGPADLGNSAEEKKLAGLLQGQVTYDRTGSKLHGRFELREPIADQIRDLEVFATVSRSAVKAYIARAKSAEARDSLGQIAADYVWWSQQSGKVPRLMSLPAVPKTVPKATKFQSNTPDWKPWAAIKFEMTDPQYFQYEVRAAKDGQSAEILARGDLNGDGKTSLFSLSMKVDKQYGHLVVSPNIVETDPTE
jgi:hypothetical protein